MSEILFADVKGIKLCYEVKGKGNPIFLVHGFGNKKEFWIAQSDNLSNEFKVIALDCRGSGKSDRPNEPYTAEMLAQDVIGLMDTLKLQKAHFIGHSLGGAVVQNIALMYPEKIDKIVLVCTFPDFPLDKSGVEMFKKNWIAMYEAKIKDPIKAFYDKMKLRFSRDFFKIMKEEPERKIFGIYSTKDLMEIDRIDPITPQDINNLTNALLTHKVLDRLQKIKAETLIIAGNKDRLASKVSSEQIHQRIPKSTLKIIPGGHFVTMEKAPEINKLIIDFLKS
ncbi:MAG: alpha/beta fold hydrolase [Promethearchaeota archaeon]|jgi:pimeloyl-ACP methyl ester carboxylesterase